MGDILPFDELSRLVGIPEGYLVLIVIGLGFVTVALAERYERIKIRNRSIDHIFLISFSGLIWLFRLKLIYLAYEIIKNLSINQSVSGVYKIFFSIETALLIVFVFFSSALDILLIVDWRPFKFVKRGRRFFKSNIPLAFLVFMIFSMIFSLKEISDNSIFVILMMATAIFPLIYILLVNYEKLVYKKPPS